MADLAFIFMVLGGAVVVFAVSYWAMDTTERLKRIEAKLARPASEEKPE